MADDDRRAAIEAAFEAAEKEVPAERVIEVEAKVVPEQAELPGFEPAEKTAEVAEAPAKVEPAEHDTAPQAWKPAEKAKWASLPPEIRTEVTRREREITKTLNDTAHARKFSNEFQQTVQPYMARIQAQGANPIQAVQNLLQADYLLATAPKAQKAQYLARLISDYDVDVEALDLALSGQKIPTGESDRVEQLLNQKLAPFQQFIANQQQTAQQREQQQTQALENEIKSFVDNPKYPHFEQVRDEMADLIELSVRKGKPLGLEAAYNKAIQLDPELAAQTSAAAANQAAQRARKASVQVGGSPAGSVTRSPAAGSDRRATIAAAFDSVGDR